LPAGTPDRRLELLSADRHFYRNSGAFSDAARLHCYFPEDRSQQYSGSAEANTDASTLIGVALPFNIKGLEQSLLLLLGNSMTVVLNGQNQALLIIHPNLDVDLRISSAELDSIHKNVEQSFLKYFVVNTGQVFEDTPLSDIDANLGGIN
jgi:hypothetical protein